MKNEKDIFLSYASEDIKKAERLKEALEEAGFTVWFDRSTLDVGDKWRKEIESTIKRCKHFIFLVSAKSLIKETYVRKELDVALEVQDATWSLELIIPIQLEDCVVSIPALRDLHILDLFTDWSRGFQRLIRALHKREGVSLVHKDIFGFDLGHGESAISVTNASTNDSPKALEIINGLTSIVTAIGISRDGSFLIGDDAYTDSEAASVEILFKSDAFESDDRSKSVGAFARECVDILRRDGKIEKEESAHFCFGCPSGWTPSARQNYRRVLNESGFENVQIIPESRAALLNAKESGDISISERDYDGVVLIIDIGSSTTDFTLVKNLQEVPVDFGHNQLGGSLIDKLIFGKALADNEAEGHKEIEPSFDKNPVSLAKCMIECRKAKEEYFSRTNSNYWGKQPCEKTVRLSGRQFFIIELWKRDVDKMLDEELP